MTGEQFLSLNKDEKQQFVKNSVVAKISSSEGRRYCIKETACCQHYVEWGWGQAPKVCPNCGSVHWQKPALEYFLFTEQDEFVKEYPDTTRLGKKMFPLILDYAKNLIQGLIKGNTTLQSDELDEKANDASTQLLEVILKDPSHKMRWSFGGYLKRLCKSVVYKTKFHDQLFSLNSKIGEDEREFGEKLATVSSSGAVHTAVDFNSESIPDFTPAHQEPEIDLSQEVINLISKASDAIWENTHKAEDCVLFLMGMCLKFKDRDEKAILPFFDVAGSQSKKFVEKGEYLVYTYLKNLVQTE